VVCISDIGNRSDVHPSGWLGYRDGSLIIFPFYDESDTVLALVSLHNRASPPFTPQDVEIGKLLLSFGKETLRATLANEALQRREREYRHLIDNLPDVFYRSDLDGNLKMVSPSARDMFGYEPDEMIGKNIFADFFAEPVEPGRGIRILLEKGQLERFEILLRRKDRSLAWISTNTHFSRDERGEVVGFEGVLSDITQRKRIEEERKRLTTAVEQAAEIVFITDPEGVVQYVNPSFERITGYTREEAVGCRPSILKSGRHPVSFYRELWETISGGQVWKGQFINRRKDGSIYEEEASIAPVRDAGGRIINFIAVKRDISREAILLDQLLQSQRMESIGSLAGGIAHDFNNILSAIIGNAELAKIEIGANSPHQDFVSRILKASFRAKDLVSQILSFGRHSQPEWSPINVSTLIRETLHLLRASMPTTIEIRQDIGLDPAFIFADSTRFQQVVMNLATNAAQAMGKKGGVLSVVLARAGSGEAFSELFPQEKADRFVRISIRDNGHGMSSEVLKHIFDPYFTTKAKGTGTGLGLTMAMSIVRSFSGQIAVRSEPGVGSEFDIFLPLCDRDEGVTPAPQEISLPRGDERILLVDDEEEILFMYRQMLEFLGYKVEVSANGVDALDRFRRGRNDFDLLITDMTMPRLTGDSLAREVKLLEPGFPVVLISGIRERYKTTPREPADFDAYLMKPVAMEELAVTIRHLLDRSATG